MQNTTEEKASKENNNTVKFAFFGTSEISVIVLDELKKAGFIPTVIVTGEDKPKGRKLVLTPPETKVWAEKENIPFLQLKTLKKPESVEAILNASQKGYDLFIVASYGKIIPQNILDIPKYKTLNVHPSLLPKLRGPSPIVSAILNENETGVSIMRLDAEMDHGPLVAQEKVDIANWPPYEAELEKTLGENGGKILAGLILDWIDGKIAEKEQDHDLATYCYKIEKAQGEIVLTDDAETNLRKIRAFHIWPGAFFFDEYGDKKVRVIVKTAHIENGELILDTVIPEGKKEMNYSDYLRGRK